MNIAEVMDIQTRGRDDFELNSLLRKGQRLKRKELAAQEAAGHAIGLPMPLLAPALEDATSAASTHFKQDRSYRYELMDKVKRAEIGAQSIFAQPPPRAGATTVATSSKPSIGAGPAIAAAVKRAKLNIQPVLATEGAKGKLIAAAKVQPPKVPAFGARIIPRPKVAVASSNTTA